MNKPLAVLCLGLVGCNFDAGDCYLRGEGEGGAGGIIITASGVGGFGVSPTGAGGFGPAPPLEPQGMEPPPPVCNIAAQSPCDEKCQADYESDSIACGKVDTEAQRRACGDSAHARYRSCRESCEQRGYDDCDEKYQDCQNKGPTSCLKKVGGQSLCQRCWERCRAGDSPSSQCRACYF